MNDYRKNGTDVSQAPDDFRMFVLMAILLVGSAMHASISLANTADQHLVPPHAVWKYHIEPRPASENWTRTEFDDSQWAEGPAGFGYGDDDDHTVLDSMRGKIDSMRIRHRFFVADPSLFHMLFLYLRYDDGFIAYLNGSEIAHGSIERQNTQTVALDHEAVEFERFHIDDPESLLHKGWNVLAIQGFNRSLDSSDFSLYPVLTNYRTGNPGVPNTISREEFLADLRALEQRIYDQASYFGLRDVDFRDAFLRLRQSAGATVSSRKFALDLEKLIAQMGDAHAGIETEFDDSDWRYLPFAFADTQDGLIALQASRDGFVDDDHPFIIAMDDTPMAVWINAASQYVAKASPQLIRHRALRELRSIDQIRRDLGMAASDSVRLTLQSPHGDRQIRLSLPLAHKRLPSGKVPIHGTRKLDGNIGYLRISAMKDERVEALVSAMHRFSKTKGLIIDVRDNTGGYYGILEALYGFFIPNNARPYVANIAAYRLSSLFAADHLYDRPTYPLDHPAWTLSQRQVIRRALKVFQPEWKLSANQFSAWHFMLLGREENHEQYYYSNPVVVLCNAASFSATDGFLSAFADLPQVVLTGQASSGGSGATQRFHLPNSGIEIALSSMASFRPNGKLYEGNGVEVDIEFAPVPGDFLGETDAVLDKAVEWISAQHGRQ